MGLAWQKRWRHIRGGSFRLAFSASRRKAARIALVAQLKKGAELADAIKLSEETYPLLDLHLRRCEALAAIIEGMDY